MFLPLILALFVVTLLVASVYSLLKGKFTPWSSRPVLFRERPLVFLGYVVGCLLVAGCFAGVLWVWFG